MQSLSLGITWCGWCDLEILRGENEMVLAIAETLGLVAFPYDTIDGRADVEPMHGIMKLPEEFRSYSIGSCVLGGRY